MKGLSLKQETTEAQPELTIEQRLANLQQSHAALGMQLQNMSAQMQAMTEQRLRIEGAISVLTEIRPKVNPTADEAATEPVEPENQ